ncbi:MAG: SDR family NAD(P)-dependent oxidoreductase [Nitrospirae bacterium]|nr:MAG: SDR family NAD(P)-dependent oxidoreductase [Nitrospirota bacterium]
MLRRSCCKSLRCGYYVTPGTLQSKAVLITGSSSGIGRMTALALANAGARLALVARRTDRLAAVVEEVRACGGAAEMFPCDVTVPGAMEAAVRGCADLYGRMDVLVNNAGVGFFATVEQTTAEDLDRILAINLKGTFHGIRAALPVMRHQGSGHIINVASTAGRRGSPYLGAYCASKFAVVGLTESLRTELLGSGIRVSLFCPGATRTEFFSAARRRTEHHRGLVGPVESAERVAERLVDLIRRPRAEVIVQPVRRKLFLMLNLIAPAVVDRLVARMIAAGGRVGRA